MDISVLVPLYNEAESLPHLYEWIVRVMKENKFSYEIVFVNDGSTDNSWEVICNLQKDNGQRTMDDGRWTMDKGRWTKDKI